MVNVQNLSIQSIINLIGEWLKSHITWLMAKLNRPRYTATVSTLISSLLSTKVSSKAINMTKKVSVFSRKP